MGLTLKEYEDLVAQCKLSELKPGDRFKIVWDTSIVENRYILEKNVYYCKDSIIELTLINGKYADVKLIANHKRAVNWDEFYSDTIVCRV
jgi:hypothetical protein